VPIEYSGEEQAICTVGIAKPRAGVFVEAIQYVLVLCTTVEVRASRLFSQQTLRAGVVWRRMWACRHEAETLAGDVGNGWCPFRLLPALACPQHIALLSRATSMQPEMKQRVGVVA
jgi:Nup133 N terminal like